LRVLRRILITLLVALAVVFVGVTWIAPVALSYYSARTAPPVARVVPTDLKDQSVAVGSGKKLSYFGYEFEIPWNDLDETQTKLYPTDKTEKCKVDLHFRSGLRLIVTAVPPREWANGLAKEMKTSPQRIEATVGQSDYRVAKTIYEFSPDKMNHWALSERVHMREEFLLIIKSIALSKSADTGIFNLENSSYKGFQQGNPQVRPDVFTVNLYSDEGSLEFILLQHDYKDSAGITQPELNRIVQSVRRTTEGAPTAAPVAEKVKAAVFLIS
jgi:hypothetical protein